MGSFVWLDNQKINSIIVDSVNTLVGLTVGIEHHEIHEGESYHYTTINTLGSGSTVSYLIIPSSDPNKKAHFRYFVEAEGSSAIYFTENASITGVTSLMMCNHNRNSTNVSGLVTMTTTGTSTGGTLLDSKSFGSGNNAPGGTFTPEEWVLKTGNTYTFTFKSNAANNITSLLFHYYETDLLI